jgi:NAD(P)-dependent dehydrogenase (short-subunit alcohol dehydrogenase family)
MRFASRVAVVTGAGDGIGRATSLLLAKEGASVVAVDVDGQALRRTADGIGAAGGLCLPVEADVLDAGDADRLVNRALARFGGIDVLVNAVGGSTILARPDAGIDEISPEEWERVLAFNLRGTYLCIHAVVPHMKQRRRGAIVNLSSIVARGDQAASRTSPPYVLAKSGLRALTRKLARDLGPFGIRCNAAAPGVTLTDRIGRLLAQRSREEREAMAAAVPLRRLATPEDVAKVVAFLASDDAGFVSGQTIEVTGGL